MKKNKMIINLIMNMMVHIYCGDGYKMNDGSVYLLNHGDNS